MLKNQSDTANILRERSKLNKRLAYEGLLVGIVSGAVCIVYRLVLSNAESIYFTIRDFVAHNVSYWPLWIIGLIVLGLIISIFLKWEPMIGGSGIPQLEAEVQGRIDECWWRVLLAKFCAGALALVGGLSLGREGPSIQLGGMVGKALAKKGKRVKTEERYLMTAGAAAGLSAAFNAPLAGIMFALEEVHKNFSTSALVSVMIASITADFLSRNIFGLSPTLAFSIKETFPLKNYIWVIILGIIAGILGAFYNKVTMGTIKLYKKTPFLKKHQRVIIPLVLSGILGFYCPLVMGGGHKLVEYLNEPNLVLSTLILLFILKLLISCVSFGSGAAGGIFFPLLILGSLIGASVGKVAIMYGVPSEYFMNFIIMAMAAYFSAIVRAPITGIVLIAEMSGTLKMLLPIALVSFVSYYVANLLHSEPIYESLLTNLLNNQPYQSMEEYADSKELIGYTVVFGSNACDHYIKDLQLPRRSLIVSVIRGGEEIIPKGDTKLISGDRIIVLVDAFHLDETKLMLESVFTSRCWKVSSQADIDKHHDFM